MDVILVQAVRSWIAGQPDDGGGWLGALRDRRVGQALGLMHRSPGDAWTVATLADAVAMSRAAFAARFTGLVGEPPLAYLTHWRMSLAASWLRDGDLGVMEIAARVGYGSEAAFSKAFKRRFGVAPAAFRRRSAAA